MSINILQSLPNTETIIQANPYNAIGYGLLVLVLLIAVGVLWNNNKHLRNENKENISKMLDINERTLPILTNVITVLKGTDEISKGLKDQLSKVRSEHETIIKLIQNSGG